MQKNAPGNRSDVGWKVLSQLMGIPKKLNANNVDGNYWWCLLIEASFGQNTKMLGLANLLEIK